MERKTNKPNYGSMRILINASNLRQGGGIQVADSICRYLGDHQDCIFVVVLPKEMTSTKEAISSYSNVEVVTYSIKNTLKLLLFQKDAFLDNIVKERRIQAVLTVFGPSRWRPSVPHLCGFARAHILPMNTPYFENLSLKEKIVNKIVKLSFKRSSDYYWTENPAITSLLESVFPNKRYYTVSNSYNQVFDDEKKWKEYELPPFNGITLLTVTNSYPHKNLELAIRVSEFLERDHPNFQFRFVYTIQATEFPQLNDKIRKHFLFIGKVDVSECPSLYKQADIMFQPTLLECFTATYPEAMKMDVPIVTTNLSFAQGLCGDAALYFSPQSANEAAQSIYSVATDNIIREKLVNAGRQQLQTFMNAKERADKLIEIVSKLDNLDN